MSYKLTFIMLFWSFFVGVSFPMRVSNTLMVLIPKKVGRVSLNDFQPINLCTFFNKVFTRILYDKMNKLLPKMISEEQSAFFKCRDIGDNVLLAQ